MPKNPFPPGVPEADPFKTTHLTDTQRLLLSCLHKIDDLEFITDPEIVMSIKRSVIVLHIRYIGFELSEGINTVLNDEGVLSARELDTLGGLITRVKKLITYLQTLDFPTRPLKEPIFSCEFVYDLCQSIYRSQKTAEAKAGSKQLKQ